MYIYLSREAFPVLQNFFLCASMVAFQENTCWHEGQGNLNPSCNARLWLLKYDWDVNVLSHSMQVYLVGGILLCTVFVWNLSIFPWENTSSQISHDLVIPSYNACVWTFKDMLEDNFYRISHMKNLNSDWDHEWHFYDTLSHLAAKMSWDINCMQILFCHVGKHYEIANLRLN